MRLFFFVFFVSLGVCAKYETTASLRGILKLPFSLRTHTLKKDHKTFLDLKKISQSKNETLDMRWKAIMSLALLFPKKSHNILLQTCTSKEWFMKNACLVSFSYTNPLLARKYALFFLKDSSLIVRTTSVKTLSQHGKPLEDSPHLWRALYDPINFRGSKSLWIRKHIVKLLFLWNVPGYTHYLSKAVKDKDIAIRHKVLKMLE